MTALVRLFEIVQKDEIFDLELKELAVALLKALDETESERINPHSIITYERLKQALVDESSKYTTIEGQAEYDRILFVLMEAWQWLVREVFVAQRPIHLSSGHTINLGWSEYFVTRRGKNKLTETA